MPGRKQKPLVWAPQYYRSVHVAERAAARIADVFRCRVLVRERWLGDGDNRGLYGVWREDIEISDEEARWFKDQGWETLFIEDAREYDEDGKLKSEKEA